MEDIDKELIKVLSGLGYPVCRQGSMSDSDDYPDTFFTFWNYETPDHSHYDNEAYGAEWSYNIYVYSIDPDKIYSLLGEARLALKRAKWIVDGRGFDVQSDEETHTGRGLAVTFLQF